MARWLSWSSKPAGRLSGVRSVRLRCVSANQLINNPSRWRAAQYQNDKSSSKRQSEASLACSNLADRPGINAPGVNMMPGTIFVSTKFLFYIIAGIFLLLLIMILLAGLSHFGSVTGA